MGKNKYGILKQVIDFYEDYEAESTDKDLLSFAKWIVKTLEKKPELNKKESVNEYLTTFNDDTPIVKRFDEKARFLEAVARVARIHEFYSRKALKDLVINTRLEYLFLHTVDMMEKAKKTDLINIYHLEYTTGMDTIRRLTKNNLLNEIPDESDKRAKLLELTERGEKILKKANARMRKENKMFLSAINDEKWRNALLILEEIEEFHDLIYQNHNDKSFSEICSLMDSMEYY